MPEYDAEAAEQIRRVLQAEKDASEGIPEALARFDEFSRWLNELPDEELLHKSRRTNLIITSLISAQYGDQFAVAEVILGHGAASGSMEKLVDLIMNVFYLGFFEGKEYAQAQGK